MSKFVRPTLLTIVILGVAALVFVLKPNQAISPNNSNPPPATTPKPKTTSIFFVGDIMLSRNVAGKIYQTNDIRLPFKKTSDVTSAADITFGNLESPFYNQGNHSVQNSLVFNGEPLAIEGLNLAGFDILSTANNHSMDQGNAGLNYTMDLLNFNGIVYTGTRYTDESLAIEPVIKHNDILYGFLAYSYTALNDGGKSKSPYINDFNDIQKMKQDIIDMKGHTADVVIVSMHAGTEYTTKPTQAQIDFAHAAIDAGADIVIGHHPHWIQKIENYNGKWIFYSLGNFVFDQMWSQETREGLTVEATYEEDQIKDIALRAVIIDDYCCPRWANKEETEKIAARLGMTLDSFKDANGYSNPHWIFDGN
jgi:hypothetical protein